jgi:hypothetical protein
MGKTAFRALLATLGLMMEQASRRSRRFKSQITRDLVVEITTSDGLAHHYEFVSGRREVVSRAGRAPSAAVSVNFETSRLGFLSLSAPDAVGRIVKLLLARRATVAGNPVLLLWFYGLTRHVIPLGRQRPLKHPLPGAAAANLDPEWRAAQDQAAKVPMVRAVAGEEIPRW